MLHERAMIANVEICTWTARKHDKAVSQEVDKSHNAQDGGRYNKMLINKTALDPITKHAGRIRAYHYSETLPWNDNGDRLLPAESYMDYMKEMRKFRHEMEQLVDTFAANYNAEVTAARGRLGTMFDANDYPHVDHIKERFSIKTSFTPVPNSSDFRIDVPQEVMAEIKQETDKQIASMTSTAIADCWSRISKAVMRVYETMSKDKPIFRDSLIEDLEEVTTTIPRLNFTNNEALNKVVTDVKERLIKRPDSLRRSRSLRESLRQISEEILRDINTLQPTA